MANITSGYEQDVAVPSVIGTYYDARSKKIEISRDKYETRIRPLMIDAKNVCKKRTKTSCSKAYDIIQALKDYNEMVINHEASGFSAFSENDKTDYDILTNFRRETMSFWKNAHEFPDVSTNMVYPCTNEIKDFLTFHWAIYMTNNMSFGNNKEIQSYAKMLYRYSKYNDKQPIEEYKNTITKEFLSTIKIVKK